MSSEWDALVEESSGIRERSFQFAIRIVKLCRALEETSGVCRVLGKQLLRSGTSIGANVEEANGSQSKADFHAKMCIATKEARETHYWLRLLAASDSFPRERLHELTDESHQIVAILTAIVRSTKASLAQKSPPKQPKA